MFERLSQVILIVLGALALAVLVMGLAISCRQAPDPNELPPSATPGGQVPTLVPAGASPTPLPANPTVTPTPTPVSYTHLTLPTSDLV